MDIWELRCWFKHGGFLTRLQAGEIKERLIKTRPASPNYKQPSGTMSESVVYIDSYSNEQVAELHQFRLPNGSLSASRMPDPKNLVINGVKFRMFSGDDEIKRDPCNLFPEFAWGLLRRVYGSFRRICCRILGPERDGKIASKMTPILRKTLFFWDSSGS